MKSIEQEIRAVLKKATAKISATVVEQEEELKRLRKETRRQQAELERYERFDEQLTELAERCGASPFGGGATGGNAIKAIAKQLTEMDDLIRQHLEEPEPVEEITHYNVLELIGELNTPLLKAFEDNELAAKTRVSLHNYHSFETLWVMGRDRRSDLTSLILSELIEGPESDIENKDCVFSVLKRNYFEIEFGHATDELLNSSLEDVMTKARQIEREVAIV